MRIMAAPIEGRFDLLPNVMAFLPQEKSNQFFKLDQGLRHLPM
jgi:hypothetical protein